MAGDYTKTYKRLYVNNKLNWLYPGIPYIDNWLLELKVKNYFISKALESLKNSIAQNNKYDIDLNLNILIEDIRASMFITYSMKDSLIKYNFTKDQIINILNNIDNVKLGYTILLIQIYDLKRYLDNNVNDNIDSMLESMHETYNQILTHIEPLRGL